MKRFLLLSTVLTRYLSDIPISTPFPQGISTAVSLSFPSTLLSLPNFFSLSAPPSVSFLPSLISSHEWLHPQYMASSPRVGRAKEIILVSHLPTSASCFAWPLYRTHRYLMFYVNKLQAIQDGDGVDLTSHLPKTAHIQRGTSGIGNDSVSIGCCYTCSALLYKIEGGTESSALPDCFLNSTGTDYTCFF